MCVLILNYVSTFEQCTAQVVGIDDVAASNSIGVSNGTPGW